MSERKELTDTELTELCFDHIPLVPEELSDAIRLCRSIIAADRALQGEQDALDAARYRWLRDECEGHQVVVDFWSDVRLIIDINDAAIDAAHAAQGATE